MMTIISILDRAATDNAFLALLAHDGERALESYDLTTEARAALLGGDIQWIESRVGPLTPHLRTWLDCRLQQEKW